jgi:3-carboxy-cis,cis-muconate cycloisomerase
MASRLIDGFATTNELADLFSDEAVIGAMLRFEAALADSQARLGIIPRTAADAIARVEGIEAGTLAGDARASASLAIPFVKALTAQAGEYVHWGATSQDVLDTALVLMLAKARDVLARDHARLAASLRALSEQHAGTVMLARTVLQPAPPTTFGYKAAGWFGGVQRSWRRLAQAFDEALQLQFGGAAGTLASYGKRGPELAVELARALDLPSPGTPSHSQRDRLAFLVTQCGVYSGAVAKIARDISLLMQPEIGEIAERGGGSSAMPNKRNPAGCVVTLAAAAQTPGLVASFLSAMVQEQERAAGGWQAEWPIVARTVQAAGSTVAAMADTVEGLTVNADRMRANIAATGGAVFAEKSALLLTAKMGRAAAQKLVAEALHANTLREGLAGQLTPEQLDSIDRPEDYLGAAEVFRLRLLNEE